MLIPGIDQYARQLTISFRDQSGDVLLPREVSTQPHKILEFFDQLMRRCSQLEEQFIAVIEELLTFVSLSTFYRWLREEQGADSSFLPEASLGRRRDRLFQCVLCQ